MDWSVCFSSWMGIVQHTQCKCCQIPARMDTRDSVTNQLTPVMMSQPPAAPELFNDMMIMSVMNSPACICGALLLYGENEIACTNVLTLDVLSMWRSPDHATMCRCFNLHNVIMCKRWVICRVGVLRVWRRERKVGCQQRLCIWAWPWEGERGEYHLTAPCPPTVHLQHNPFSYLHPQCTTHAHTSSSTHSFLNPQYTTHTNAPSQPSWHTLISSLPTLHIGHHQIVAQFARW